MNPAPLLVSPPRDGPIIDLGSEHRYEGEYDQHPRRKASVPNESVNHECDSSFDAPGRPRQPLPEKSAVLGRDGGFSFADLQHPPQSNAPNDDAARALRRIVIHPAQWVYATAHRPAAVTWDSKSVRFDCETPMA